MVLELLAAILIGMGFGVFTGLTPGIHVNLVAATLLAVSPSLLAIASPLSLCTFIMSLAVTHSFLDTLPSTFLGAPDSEEAMSVLPAQKLLLKGEAHQAVMLSVTGAYAGLLLAIMLIPAFIIVAPLIAEWLKPWLKYLLPAIAAYVLLKEKEKFWCAALFLLSGTLGVIVFAIPTLKDPMFPLLSGLFGVSGLLLSFFENTTIPEQEFESRISISPHELLKTLSASSLAVFLIQFFPGLGPAQGASISNQVIRGIKDKAYLVLTGAIGTMSVVFSLVTFYTLGKAKDGSIVAMSKLLEISTLSFAILALSFLAAGSLSVIITLSLSRKFAGLIAKANYRLMAASIIIFIIAMAGFLAGWIGLIVLATSTAVGLIAPLKNIPRSHAMGCLLLPVIIYLLA